MAKHLIKFAATDGKDFWANMFDTLDEARALCLRDTTGFCTHVEKFDYREEPDGQHELERRQVVWTKDADDIERQMGGTNWWDSPAAERMWREDAADTEREE